MNRKTGISCKTEKTITLLLIFGIAGLIPLTLYTSPAVIVAGLALLAVAGVLLYVVAHRNNRSIHSSLNTVTGIGSNIFEDHISIVTERENEARTFVDALANNKDIPSLKKLSSSDALGASLLELRRTIAEYRTEDDKRNWVQGGLAKFSSITKEGNSIEQLATRLISELVRYTDVNQGGFFVYQEEDEGYLELMGCYAYNKNKILDKKISKGQGLLGECILSKTVIFMTDVPGNYVKITSGLGDALPRNIIILPLLFNNQFYGALELASFSVLEPHKVDFLKKVSELIAAEVATRKTVELTKGLLQQSEELTRQLQQHDEELKQQMEELTATQEEMERKQAELNSVFSAINNTVASVEFDMTGAILHANDIFLSVSGYQLSEITRHTYRNLLCSQERMKPQHEVMWTNLKESKFFSGEFKFISRNGEDMWLSGTFNPMFDKNGRPYKVIMIANFITQEKQKQADLTNMLTAARNAILMLELDANFKCRSANERFMKLFGLKRLDLKEKPFHTLLDCQQKESFAHKMMHLMDSSYVEENLAFVTPEEIMSFRTSFSIVRDGNGNVQKILVILADKIYNPKVAAVA